MRWNRWNPSVIVAAAWMMVLTSIVAYWAQEYSTDAIKPVKAEVLSAHTDHIIYSTTWWTVMDCKRQIDRFILEEYTKRDSVPTSISNGTAVTKDDVTYHRSSVPGWSRPGIPIPQLRRSVVRVGGLRLPEWRTLQLFIVTNSFCPLSNKWDRYDPVSFTVPSGSDDGLTINRFDEGP